jgi:hypothetical protein
MQTDPVVEWRRLTEHYRALGDEQLRALALDFRDLTEMAQQALRAELHSRRLGDPQTIAQAAQNPVPARASAPARELLPEPANELGDASAEETGAGDAECEDEAEGPHDFTWKVLLCECEEWKQAWQLGQALSRAGVDNWPEHARRTGQLYSRIFVAADQLEQARAIASQPIPQDILEESEAEPSAYVAPTCPGCGSADPVLESADPLNAWHCEVCGRDWTEAPEADLKTPPEGRGGTIFGMRGA